MRRTAVVAAFIALLAAGAPARADEAGIGAGVLGMDVGQLAVTGGLIGGLTVAALVSTGSAQFTLAAALLAAMATSVTATYSPAE